MKATKVPPMPKDWPWGKREWEEIYLRLFAGNQRRVVTRHLSVCPVCGKVILHGGLNVHFGSAHRDKMEAIPEIREAIERATETGECPLCGAPIAKDRPAGRPHIMRSHLFSKHLDLLAKYWEEFTGHPFDENDLKPVTIRVWRSGNFRLGDSDETREEPVKEPEGTSENIEEEGGMADKTEEMKPDEEKTAYNITEDEVGNVSEPVDSFTAAPDSVTPPEGAEAQPSPEEAPEEPEEAVTAAEEPMPTMQLEEPPEEVTMEITEDVEETPLSSYLEERVTVLEEGEPREHKETEGEADKEERIPAKRKKKPLFWVGMAAALGVIGFSLYKLFAIRRQGGNQTGVAANPPQSPAPLPPAGGVQSDKGSPSPGGNSQGLMIPPEAFGQAPQRGGFQSRKYQGLKIKFGPE